MKLAHVIQEFAPFSLILFLSSCDSLTGAPVTEWDILPGTIQFYQQPIVIEHPDTIELGAALPVLVRTYGGGCTAQGPTETAITAMTITVAPFDSIIRPREDLACPDILKTYDHEVTVSVPQSGTYTLRFVGNREPGSEAVDFQRAMVVR